MLSQTDSLWTMKKDTFAQVWKKKYGSYTDTFEPRLIDLLRHTSVRQFTKKSVSEKKIRVLFAAAQSASTSANLQLWSAVSVQNRRHRNQIAKASGEQTHVRDCAWFFVFLADHYRVAAAAKKQGVDPWSLDLTEMYTMAVIDAALAAERMACAAEILGLGVCYIGGIRSNPPAIKTILKLPKKTFALFGLCIGVPSAEAKGDIKPRLSQQTVWSREFYNKLPDILEYDARSSKYYNENRGIDTNWSKLSSKRTSGRFEGGRADQKAWLKSQGFKLD